MSGIMERSDACAIEEALGNSGITTTASRIELLFHHEIFAVICDPNIDPVKLKEALDSLKLQGHKSPAFRRIRR